MLILKCRARESIWIGPGDVALDTPVGEVFKAGLIEVVISCIEKRRVFVRVDVPPNFLVHRDEVIPQISGVGGSSQNTRTRLAQKLTALRLIKKLSREDLARISGVPIDTLKNAEQLGARLGLDEFEALAKALDISVAELLKPPGATAEERVVLALIEEGSE